MADETSETQFTPPAAEPTPTVGADEATRGHPAGSAAPHPPAAAAPTSPFSSGSSGASGSSSNPVAGLLENPKVAETIEQRPEALVGAAFAGGLLFAMILKRLGR